MTPRRRNHPAFHSAVMLTCLLLAGCGSTWKIQKRTGLLAEAECSIRFGVINGFLQTPAGGRPGSSSKKRPSLEELDVDDVAMTEVRGSFGWGPHSLIGKARLLAISRQSTLDASLVSNNTHFPPDSSVELSARLNSYRIGYRYSLILANDQGATVGLHPTIGIYLFNFHYRLSDLTNGVADRSYTKGAAQAGMEIEWCPKSPFSGVLKFYGSVPVGSAPLILAAEVLGRYRLWRWSGTEGRAFAGIGYERFDYEDEQELPNHIRTTLAPLIFIGLQVKL